MKERPILFSATMVRALLDGRKTQTRRVMKHRPEPGCVGTFGPGMPFIRTEGGNHSCPYGAPGDRLWVRETFCPIYPQDPTYNGGRPIAYDYAATYQYGDRLGDALGIKKRWKPSIHMPRRASRITLEVTGVRVERLQDISEQDALAEGVFRKTGSSPIGDVVETAAGGELIYANNSQARVEFFRLWQSINGAGSWEANPRVWVIEFEVMK